MANDTKHWLPIINGALFKIGLPPAETLEDASWGGLTRFESVAKQVFRTFPWGFAQKYAVLETNSNLPSFGWNYAYTFPTDYIRLIDIHTNKDLRSFKCRYCISNGVILANVNPCYARYVAYIDDAANWPYDFADAVSALLAATIAPLAAQTQAMTPSLIQLYQLSLTQAQNSDATETTERVPLDEDIYMARTGTRTQQ